jgi:hypothetical protein
VGGGGRSTSWAQPGREWLGVRRWTAGHLGPSASGGPTGLVTSGGRLAHPRFSPLMEAATAIGRFFAQGAHGEAARRRGPALAGEGSPHLRGREDCHVAIWQWFAAVTANRRDPGDGQGRGQWSQTRTPRPAAAAMSVLGRLVLCTAVGAATEVATTRMALPLDPLPRVQRERPSGGGPLRSKLNCGQKCHP